MMDLKTWLEDQGLTVRELAEDLDVRLWAKVRDPWESGPAQPVRPGHMRPPLGH